jgi:hypothetical protein
METTTESVAPGDIGLDFVPELEPELEVVTVGDERVVLGESGRLVALNSTASLIFEFLDGDASLAELVDDFTEALGVDRSVVETDVLTFVRDLGENGFLVGVRLDDHVDDVPFVLQEIASLEVGDALDDFVLPQLDGDERSLSEYRGRRMLLVNWSPSCGFCVRIAGELADLAPQLAERDVVLAFIASGDADANRELNEVHGLTAPMWLRSGSDVDAFRGTGTPAAYVLDDDLTLAEPMFVGADQVPRIARELAGVDLDDQLAPPPGEERVRYLPAPGATCGPGGGSTGSSTDWLGTRAYALGSYHVGVRYDDDETALVLDRLFADAWVDDPRVNDNYAVALGGTRTTRGAGASRSLKLLVQGGTQLVRSRSGARVLAALLQYVSADLEPVEPSLARANVTAVVRDGVALLLPAGLLAHVKRLQPRLARAGMALVDTPRVLLDLEARELVVPEPVVPYDATVLDDLDRDVRLGSELPWVRPGRFPLHTWFLVRGDDALGPLTPGVAITAALPQLFERDDRRQRVEHLVELFRTVTPVGVWFHTIDELVEQAEAAR